MIERPFRVYMRRALIEELKRHALEALPDEACGLLGGTVLAAEPDEAFGERVLEVRVERVYRTTNALPPELRPIRYEIAPKELLEVLTRRIPADGLEHVGIYHSHVNGPDHPSPTDVRQSFYPNAAYLLVSRVRSGELKVGAFRILRSLETEVGAGDDFRRFIHPAELIVEE